MSKKTRHVIPANFFFFFCLSIVIQQHIDILHVFKHHLLHIGARSDKDDDIKNDDYVQSTTKRDKIRKRIFSKHFYKYHNRLFKDDYKNIHVEIIHPNVIEYVHVDPDDQDDTKG